MHSFIKTVACNNFLESSMASTSKNSDGLQMKARTPVLFEGIECN